MSIKAKIEALIYAAEEPISLDHMATLLKDELLALKNQPQPEAPADLPVDFASFTGEEPQPEKTQAADDQASPADEATQIESAPQMEDPRPAERSSEPAALPDAPADRKAAEKKEKVELRNLLKPILDEVIAACASEDRGIEIRKVAGGYRMSTKPEHHDVVRSFAKSLKPPIRLSLQALETLAVIAYKQPVTVPEISDIRGVDSSGVIGTLFDRKLITTAGRKSVVGRPMLYKTTKDFLMRFGLSDLNELPSIEEFEKLAIGDGQGDLFAMRDTAIADATGVPDSDEPAEASGTGDTQAAHETEGAESFSGEPDLYGEAGPAEVATEEAGDPASEEAISAMGSADHADQQDESSEQESSEQESSEHVTSERKGD